MKYADYHESIPQDKREELNQKVLCLIESGQAEANGITREDIFNAYTGIGGLHGLDRKNFANYHEYSEQKKQLENGQFFTPPMPRHSGNIFRIASCLRTSCSTRHRANREYLYLGADHSLTF